MLRVLKTKAPPTLGTVIVDPLLVTTPVWIYWIRFCASSLPARGIFCRIVVSGEPGGPVHGDPELLRRAVENVLRNAIRYAPEDSDIDLILDRRNARLDLCRHELAVDLACLPQEVQRRLESLYALPAHALEVKMTPSVAGSIFGALDYLTSYPYGCTEQTMSGFLPDIVVAKAMKDLKLESTVNTPELEKKIRAGLDRLYDFQHDDGGDEAEGEGGGIFADINITPLTDIFLVLLIIFMVTTTAIAEAGQDKGGFKVNLPKGSKGDAGEVARDLVVAILADGRAVVGGKVQDPEALTRTFEASAKLNPDTVLVVQADAGVPHGRVVDVMEAARRAGAAPAITVILLDALNTPWEDQVWARGEVIKFLEQMQPGDRVALYGLGRELRVLHDFTSDASTLLQALGIYRERIANELAASDSQQSAADLFAIGGNHFLHAARRNMDLTVICVNNFNYGMTGGEHSVTTPSGGYTSSTPLGQLEQPMDICQTVAVNGASFVGRSTN